MERSVYFLIGPHDNLVKRNSNNEQNTNDASFTTGIDQNTNMITDSYNVSELTVDTSNNVSNNNTYKFVGVRSLFNTTFAQDFYNTMSTEKFTEKSYAYINYRGLASGFDPSKVNGKGLGTPQQVATVNYGDIIRWTNTSDKKALIIRPSDLVYHKDFGVYSPNRMLVVRRFASATPHDLFSFGQYPTSVMVTWIKPEEIPFSISFHEKWKTSNESIISVINDVLGFANVHLPDWGTVTTLDQIAFLPIVTALGITPSANNPLGNPDVIHEAAIRETDFKGLHSDFVVDFKAEYEIKYIDGVDPNLAYLDIIANITRMSTSDPQFVANPEFGVNVSELLKNVEGGNLDNVIQAMITGIGSIIQTVSDKFLNVNKAPPPINNNANASTQAQPFGQFTPTGPQANANANSATPGSSVSTGTSTNSLSSVISNIVNTSGSQISSLISSAVQTTLSKYKWRMTGAIASMSGMHTAHWHVTMGNPMCPWFSCGNMFIDDMTIDFPTAEMSYGDMPQRIKVSAKFKPGRVMGAYEIQQLFNAGKDRIYKYAPPIQIGVKLPSASAPQSTK